MGTRLQHLLAFAALLVAPRVVEAQFAAYMPPRDRVTEKERAVAVERRKVRRDSVARVQVANMKVWVDSAAGVPPSRFDSAGGHARKSAAIDTTRLANVPKKRNVRSQFRNGARAPATASALPAVLFVGAGLLGFGIMLLMRDERRTQSARRRITKRA